MMGDKAEMETLTTNGRGERVVSMTRSRSGEIDEKETVKDTGGVLMRRGLPEVPEEYTLKRNQNLSVASNCGIKFCHRAA